MTGVGTFAFDVDGPIVGKERARHAVYRSGKSAFVKTYTPAKTVQAEARIALAWRLAGSPTMPPGVPLRVCVEIHLPRPATHYRKDGSLSAAGLRSPLPVKRPDVDNVVKTILDALNAKAWADDSAVCTLVASKVWSREPLLRISVSTI